MNGRRNIFTPADLHFHIEEIIPQLLTYWMLLAK